MDDSALRRFMQDLNDATRSILSREDIQSKGKAPLHNGENHASEPLHIRKRSSFRLSGMSPVRSLRDRRSSLGRVSQRDSHYQNGASSSTESLPFVSAHGTPISPSRLENARSSRAKEGTSLGSGQCTALPLNNTQSGCEADTSSQSNTEIVHNLGASLQAISREQGMESSISHSAPLVDPGPNLRGHPAETQHIATTPAQNNAEVSAVATSTPTAPFDQVLPIITNTSRSSSISSKRRGIFLDDSQDREDETFIREVLIDGWREVSRRTGSYVSYSIIFTLATQGPEEAYPGQDSLAEAPTIHIHRRYSAFLTLHQRFNREYFHLHKIMPNFPPKAFYRPSILVKRKRQLQAWLTWICLHPETGGSQLLKDWIFEPDDV